MSCYHHLTIVERDRILKYISQGQSIRSCAKVLCRSPSTISRELRRNEQDYLPSVAQKRYEDCRKRSCRQLKLLKDEHLRSIVHFCLVYLWWSPEQICERLAFEHSARIISTSTIYRALHNGGLRQTMKQHLRIAGNRHGKNRRSTKSMPHHISERPTCANNRQRLGDFEADLVLVPRQGKSILSCVDRKSRYLLSCLTTQKPDDVRNALSALLGQLPKDKRHTITLDRGIEFGYVYQLETQMDLPAYFCDAYQPRQRATNENTNGLLRQFFPKYSVTFPLNENSLNHFVALLNLRPRKCLAWHSPFEVFHHLPLHFT